MNKAESILKKITANEMREPTDERILQAMKEIAFLAWLESCLVNIEHIDPVELKFEKKQFEIFWEM